MKIKNLVRTLCVGLMIHNPVNASLVSVNSGFWFPSQTNEISSTPAHSSHLIDASGERVAFIFTIPKTGTITDIGIMTGNVTTAQSLDVGMQTVSASTGWPTGTMYGGCSSGTIPSPSTATAYTTTLATPASAVIGDVASVVVGFTSTIGSVNIRGFGGVLGEINGAFNTYTATFGVSWAAQTANPLLWVLYSDGNYYYIPYTYPVTTINATSYTSSSTPDERALRFSVPFPAKISGGVIHGQAATDGTALVLYDSDSVALTSATIDGNQSYSVTGVQVFRFPVDYEISADTVYRLSVKAVSAGNTIVYSLSVPSTGTLAGFNGGYELYESTRSDAGAWTDITTNRPLIGMWITSLDDGTGSGSGSSTGDSQYQRKH